jgi:hypothetical protein
MKSLKVLILLTLLYPLVLSAQQKQVPEDLFDDAIFFYNLEDYKESAFLFQQLLMENPENANFNFYAGMSLLNVNGQEKKAIPYLEKAVRYTGIKVKPRKFKEKRAPHYAWFYLGNAYRISNRLDDALDSYHKFLNIKNFEKHYNLRILEEEISACSRAKIIQDSPLQLKKENLGEPVNTSASDYNPVLSADENTIVYVSSQRFYEAIMISKRTGRSWSTPVNITSQIGSDGDMFPTFLTADGTTLYLVKRKKADGDIYISTFNGNIWTIAKPVNDINTRADEAHASLSSDGNFLYFSSDRKGGSGGLDLYVSEKQADGGWGPAVNLGENINSTADENTPFLSLDGSTLYFSSTGHFNMGGYDIFFSRKNSSAEWESPINIGYPINTTNDDRFFFPIGINHSGYISIYDDEEGIGQEDIYRVKITSFTETPEKLKHFDYNFLMELKEIESGETIEIHYDRKSDSFDVKGTRGRKYNIEVQEKQVK